VLEIDEDTHEVLRRLPVGGRPQGLAVSPDGTELYIADELGHLVVWDLPANTLKQEVSAPPGAFGLALTPDAAQIYITVAGGTDGVVAVYDRASRALVRTIATVARPGGSRFDITGETAIVTNEASEVQIIK